MKNSAAKKKHQEKTPVLSGNPEPIKLSDGDLITVKEITFRSKEAYNYLRGADDTKDAFVKAVITGAVALERAQTSIDMDYIGKQMGEMLNKIQGNLIKLIDPLSDGSLGKKLSEIFKAQNESLLGFLSQGNTAVGDLDKKITEFSERIRKELDQAITSQLSDESGRLGTILRELKNDINILRDSVVASKTAATTSAPLIGSSFEESCMSLLEDFCQSHGLIFEDVRNTPGSTGSKKGDFTIESENCVRLVLEMKKQSAPMSLNACLTELDQALENRNAEIALLIGTTDCIPAAAGMYNEYSDSKIICNAEVMEIALKVALTKSKIKANNQKSIKTVDVQLLSTYLQEFQTSLPLFSKMRSNLRAIKKAADKLVSHEEDIRTNIESLTCKMMEVLNNGNGNDNGE